MLLSLQFLEQEDFSDDNKAWFIERCDCSFKKNLLQFSDVTVGEQSYVVRDELFGAVHVRHHYLKQVSFLLHYFPLINFLFASRPILVSELDSPKSLLTTVQL